MDEMICINTMAQVLYECGIYSTFLPRSWFRGSCCDFKRTDSYLSFHAPSHANHKIQALNVYILYAYADRCCVKIKNMSKDLIWIYWPVCNSVPDFDQDWQWSSHWKTGHQVIIEGGDKIVVQIINYKVKEVGVQILWDEDEENGKQHAIIKKLC